MKREIENKTWPPPGATDARRAISEWLAGGGVDPRFAARDADLIEVEARVAYIEEVRCLNGMRIFGLGRREMAWLRKKFLGKADMPVRDWMFRPEDGAWEIITC